MSLKDPCTFKPCCRTCTKVELSERPTGCSAIECEDYAPCPMCGQNRTLHDSVVGKRCRNCIKLPHTKVARETARLREIVSSGNGDEEPQPSNPLNTGEEEHRVAIPGIGKSISYPGVPPEELRPNEKEYYAHRWAEYEGYYRNPSAYYNVHQLILLEIHSNYLNFKLSSARGELKTDLSRELQVTINLRKTVTDLLPDKEAVDVMDDEKSLSAIYDVYRREKKDMNLGHVSRIFRRDTLALAPSLHFPIDPKLLLERAGFTVIDIERVLPKLKEFSADKTAEEVLEFFGFNLKEEYAMPTGDRLADTDDFDPEEELYGTPE